MDSQIPIDSSLQYKPESVLKPTLYCPISMRFAGQNNYPLILFIRCFGIFPTDCGGYCARDSIHCAQVALQMVVAGNLLVFLRGSSKFNLITYNLKKYIIST